ncbi:hypothetical protein R6Q59_011475 [Mikania micrantha]
MAPLPPINSSIYGRSTGSSSLCSTPTDRPVTEASPERRSFDRRPKLLPNAEGIFSVLYNPQHQHLLTFLMMNPTEYGHSKVGSLKTVSLSFPDLCAVLFDGNSTTGSFKWTLTQTTSMVRSSSCHRVQQLLIADSVFQDIDV